MEYKVALCDDDEKIASKIMEAFNNELHAHNLEATIDYYSSGNVLIEAVKEKHYNLALIWHSTIYMFHFIRYKNSFRNFTWGTCIWYIWIYTILLYQKEILWNRCEKACKQTYTYRPAHHFGSSWKERFNYKHWLCKYQVRGQSGSYAQYIYNLWKLST